MIRIPGVTKDGVRTNWTQVNEGDTLGTLSGSFGIDLRTSRGKVLTTKLKLITHSGTETDLKTPVAFRNYENNYYALSDDAIYKGGDAISDAFTKDVSANAPNNVGEDTGDMELFNSRLYVAEDDDLTRLDGSTWSTPGSLNNVLNSGPHLMEVLGDRCYVTDESTKVLSFNTSEVFASSGSNTLSLGLDSSSHKISVLKAGNNSLWVGDLNTGGQNGSVYVWDGETENTASNKYIIDSPGPLAGLIRRRDNRPFIVDAFGRLLSFNGSGFEEVARLPVDRNKILDYSLSGGNTTRPIHPNGMSERDDEIWILVKGGYLDGSVQEQYMNDGIWAYSEINGLYHKYSLSYSANADTGTTNLTDHGQMRLGTQIGALEASISPDGSPAAGDNGTALIGARYYTDATTQRYGIFANDFADTTQKYSHIITSQIHSTNIKDAWQKFWITHRKLLDSGDFIVAKYRTEEVAPEEFTITWSDTDTFTSTDDLSNVVLGNEVEVLQGTGAGKTAHISSISEAAGTYTVNLDTTFTGASGTAKIRTQNWQKAGTHAEQILQYKDFPCDGDNTWIQLKICMQFTGRNELHGIMLANKGAISVE